MCIDKTLLKLLIREWWMRYLTAMMWLEERTGLTRGKLLLSDTEQASGASTKRQTNKCHYSKRGHTVATCRASKDNAHTIQLEKKTDKCQ